MSDSEIANDEATEYTLLAQCSVLAIADLILIFLGHVFITRCK